MEEIKFKSSLLNEYLKEELNKEVFTIEDINRINTLELDCLKIKISGSDLIQILNNYISHIDTGSIIKVDRNLNLTLKVPYMLLILVVIIVWIIIRISSILSIRKIDKITPMEAIRDNINLKKLYRNIKFKKF